MGVYVAQLTRVESKETSLSERERLMVLEIGNDKIDSASCFVEYMSYTYGISKSSVWYCLNRLKESGFVDFANRAEQGKPLALTKRGTSELAHLEHERNVIVERFSSMRTRQLRTMRGVDGRNYAFA